MKLYEVSYLNMDNEDVTATYTEAEIIEEYWHYWHGKMIEKFGEGNPLITIENCIEDWIVVNWATDVSIPI
jgi:hypothetical protein